MSKNALSDGIARQELNLIFVIDNSGSMEGEKIGAVNNAIRDVLSIMPEIQEDTSDALIKISALTFNDEAVWVYNEPKTVGNFRWTDIRAEGTTDFSKAYKTLGHYLSRHSAGGQMPDLGGVAPILILLTDGLPTSEDWEFALAELRRKAWFKVALKYAIAVEVDTPEAFDVLAKFTGNSETVLKVYTAESLRKVIKIIAVTASKVKSNSASITGGVPESNNEIAKAEIAECLREEHDIAGFGD